MADLIDLRCPYCDNALRIVTRSVGSYSMREDVPESIECAAYYIPAVGEKAVSCQAEWEIDGQARKLPDYLLHPDLYDKPLPGHGPKGNDSKAGNE